jgi:hypothetical protein
MELLLKKNAFSSENQSPSVSLLLALLSFLSIMKNADFFQLFTFRALTRVLNSAFLGIFKKSAITLRECEIS